MSSEKSIFDKVVNSSAAEVLADEICEVIESGQYSSGGELPPVRFLMRRFGRSYGTVKDALNILADRGIVYINEVNGHNVYHIAGKDYFEESRLRQSDLNHILRIRTVSITDIVEYMMAAEPEIVKLTAERYTWEDALRIEKQLDKSIEMADDAAGYFAAVMELHYRLVQGAHNPLATTLWRTGTSFLKSVAAVINYDNSKLYRTHRVLIDAIRRRDGDAAAEIDRTCWKLYDSAFTGLLIYDQELGNVDTAAAAGKTINRASDRIYEQIRGRILDGMFRPGETLPSERELSEAFERSRPVVREALRRLAVEKYITIIPRSGIVINDIDDNELIEVIDNLEKYDAVTGDSLIELRMIGEAITAGLAASRRTDKDISELKAVLAKSADYIKSRKEFIEYGVDFNIKVTRASHNGMAYIVNQMTGVFMSDRFETEPSEETIRQNYQILEQHTRILDSIINCDKQAAAAATLEHLTTLGLIMR